MLSAAAYGQISQASLHGTVKDSTGAVVPGAAVMLTSSATSTSRSVTTGADGQYTITNIDPGDYRLTFSYHGFKTFAISNLVLATGQSATVDATLAVGEATQQVTVSSEVPLLSTTSSDVSHLVPPEQVANMPLNGRNFWELTQLTPGATFTPRAQLAQFNGSEIRARAVNVTVNGQPYEFTGWSLDGANITNFELGGTLIQPNVDAIEEFRVEASNMSAEYGHTPNVINASLKSGSNAFHGDVFDYLRNDIFDARNFFLPKPLPLKRNQFGFTLGGPIYRNKVFFFADYQGTRLRQGQSFNDVVPSAQERTGNFSDLAKQLINPVTGQHFGGNVIPASLISPQANYLLQYMPLPNTLQGSTSRSIFASNLPLNNDEGDVRLDIHATEKDSIMARYSISDNNEFDPSPYPAMQGSSLHSKAQDVTLRWTHLFTPKLLNVAQASYYDSPFVFGTILAGVNIDGLAGIQGFSNPIITPEQSFPLINISGYQGYQGSPSDQRPKSIRVRDWQYDDSVTYATGKHDLKVGTEIMPMKHVFSIGQNSVGNFSFVGTYTGNAFADFLLGYPDNATRSPFQTTQGDYGTFYAIYANDNYRITNNLTLNLGVRFEINPFYNGIRGTRSGFDYQTGQIVVPAGVENLPFVQPIFPELLSAFQDRILYSNQLGLPESISPQNYDWAPRVGFAWTPDALQKTVIRAGYGIFYTFPDTNLINNTVVTVPFVYNQTIFNTRPPAAPALTFGNFFQGPLQAGLNPNPGQPCSFGLVLKSCDTPSVMSADINLHQQYTQQWNFSIQHQFANGTALTVAYLGNKTTHLQQFRPENSPPPGPGAIQSRRIYPQWGPISMAEWAGKANYNALQTQIETRAWKGLTLMGSYVWSRCMDDGTDEGSAPATQLIGLNYAPCDFNQKHTATISGTYNLPFGHGKTFMSSAPRIVDELLGEWILSGVATMKSGLPYTPTISLDRANTGASSEHAQVVGTPFTTNNVSCWFYTSANPSCVSQYPSVSNAFGLPALYTYGDAGRNILTAERLMQLDVSLLKDFPVHESLHVQFRAEFFNIFNHPVFAAPVSNVDISSGGQVSSTLNSDRILEFALKIIF
ncbi:MAG TPA: TonB-dependent receptor [Bryobacteraceae bacterium]|nr:TonB-dependent receptor [Bryobacteraceae bacterium]